MNNIHNYVKSKIIEKQIDDLQDSMMSESMDDIKYKAEKIKSKWNKFWDWLWGDNEDYYNQYSSDYNHEKFQSEVIDVYNDLDEKTKKKSLKTKWVKVDSNVEKNFEEITKVLEVSDIKKQTGMWKTNYMLKEAKLSIKSCKYAMCIYSLMLPERMTENIAILITLYNNNIVMIDIHPDYESIVDWNDIYKYITSNAFTKNTVENEFTVTLYKTYEKDDQIKNLFKTKEKSKNEDFNVYKITLKK